MIYRMPYERSYMYPKPYNSYNMKGSKDKMEVDGEGIVKVTPDTAVVTLGVITENELLEVAQKQNAEIASRIKETLIGMGIKEKDIKTVAYNIRQIYDFQDGERIFRGYEVTNLFEISIKGIERVGEIIDASVTNGANYVGNIDFRVSNQSLYYKQALILAVKDAAIKAREIARTIGVTVNEIPSEITEVNYSSLCAPPLRSVFRAPEEATPISPGQQEICARVKAVFNY